MATTTYWVHSDEEDYKKFGIYKSRENDSYSQVSNVLKWNKKPPKQNAKNLSSLENALNKMFYNKKNNDAYNKILEFTDKAFEKSFPLIEMGATGRAKIKKITSSNAKYLSDYIQEKIDKLYQEGKEMMINGTSLHKAQQYVNTINQMIKTISKQKPLIFSDKHANMLNEAMEIASFPLNLAQGDYFEIFLAHAGEYLRYESERKVDQEIKKVFPEGFSETAMKAKIGGGYSSNQTVKLNEDTVAKESLTRNKADVEITYRGSKYRISAKNYTSNAAVKILESSPFDSFVSELSEIPRTHWLNIIRTQDKNLLNLAHNTMMKIILFKSLTGGSISGAANVVILKDSRKIYVRSMQDIYERMLNKNTWRGFTVSGYSPTSFKFNASGSVGGVLKELRSIKISAHLTQASIRGALK